MTLQILHTIIGILVLIAALLFIWFIADEHPTGSIRARTQYIVQMILAVCLVCGFFVVVGWIIGHAIFD